jgi:hypothetical protein
MPRQRTGNKNGRPNKSGLNARQLRAAELDYPHINWGVLDAMVIQRRPRERVSRLPAKDLAKMVGVEERIVQQWRTQDPFYRAQLIKWFIERNAKKVRDPSDDVDQAALALRKRWDEGMEAIVRDMDRYLGKDWPPEGVKSPIDGEGYTTPGRLAIHLQNHKPYCVPAEMVKELVASIGLKKLEELRDLPKTRSKEDPGETVRRPPIEDPDSPLRIRFVVMGNSPQPPHQGSEDWVLEPPNQSQLSRPIKDKK